MPELPPYRQGFARVTGADNPDTQAEPPFSADQQRTLECIGGVVDLGTIPRGSMKRRVIMTVAIVWLVAGFIVSAGFVRTLTHADGPLAFLSDGGFSCVTFLFVMLGGIAIWLGGSWVWDKTIGVRLEAPVLNVDVHPLKPGQTLDLSYTQRVKSPVQVQGIDFRLIRRETATYTSGTDKHTVVHDVEVLSDARPGRQTSAGSMLDERAELRIPPDAMHTFIRTRNKIQYFLTVRVRLAGWIDSFEEYEIILEA